MMTRKIMLLGEIAVGKTSLVRRLVLDRFEADYKATIGVDLYTHDVDLDHDGERQTCRQVIWDIDGDLSESIFSHVYVRGASGAMIIGDGTRPATMDTMLRLSEGFRSHLPGRPVAFVINKSDLFRGATPPAVPSGLLEGTVPCFTTSASTGHNVRSAFAALANDVARSHV